MPYILAHKSITSFYKETNLVIDDYLARKLTFKEAEKIIQDLFQLNASLPLETSLYSAGVFNKTITRLVGSRRLRIVKEMLGEKDYPLRGV